MGGSGRGLAAATSLKFEDLPVGYEDVIGLPLVATWCEINELFGDPQIRNRPSGSCAGGRDVVSQLSLDVQACEQLLRVQVHRLVPGGDRCARLWNRIRGCPLRNSNVVAAAG